VPADAVLDDTWYYDLDLSQAGKEARPIYEARVALVNIRVFASEFEKFCRGWCGDPSDRMLDVAALFDYPEFMQAFAAMRDGTELDMDSPAVAASMRNAAEIAAGPLFAQWMAKEGIDALLFPASSDVDSDTRFGMNYLSELGAPGLFIPAAYVRGTGGGAGAQTRQPLGVALVTGRFKEARLLELGSAVEGALHARIDPPATPPLADEKITFDGAIPPSSRSEKEPPVLTIDSVERSATGGINASGHSEDSSGIAVLRVYVDGVKANVTLSGHRWVAEVPTTEQGAVPEALVIAFARDALGNATAAWRGLRSAKDRFHE